MTVPMSVQESIRLLDSQGVSGREIARQLGVSRSAVAKYVSQEDFSPAPVGTAVRPRASVMTGFEHVVEEWLVDDQRQPRKQRHTAQRVFDRLVTEQGYLGSYSAVQRFVRRWLERHRSEGQGFNELVWPAGTAQVDFGEAKVILAGISQIVHIFVVTFPFSNMRFVQAYGGETAECVCHGLRQLFEHIGGVPRVLVFDNATGIGRRMGKKVVESKLFGAFKLHYRAQSRYCNPYSGHEKGSVENAVGFLRRNFMVPIPEATNINVLNEVLMAQCDALATTKHYRKGLTLGELFGEDKVSIRRLGGH